jgi:plasmid stability protein
VRTTLTLDDDLALLLHRRAAETGRSFKEVVNEAIRHGLSRAPAPTPVVIPAAHATGRPRVDLVKALALAEELDDAELAAHLSRPE